MEMLKKYIATKMHIVRIGVWITVTVALLQTGNALAQPVGTVVNLTGPLLAHSASGAVKVLSIKSSIEPEDLLESGKNTYARIVFIDQSEVMLRPDTQFKIDVFSYDEAKPDNDKALFTLIKGGLRTVTGMLGKRSKEKNMLNTPSATINVRDATIFVEYRPATNQALNTYLGSSMAMLDTDTTSDMAGERYAAWPKTLPIKLAQNTVTSGLNPGLYVQVLDGTIHATNLGGTQNFTAGQFGFTPSFQQPPVILPTNPGIQFAPPPSFSSTTASGTGKPGGVDCIVR